MTSQTRPMTDLLLAFAGPLLWAGHFFSLYLTEALLCTAQGAATQTTLRTIGGALTVCAVAAMLALARRQRHDLSVPGRSAALPFAVPLTLLSALAVLWTSLPLFLLPACTPGGA